MQTAGSSSLSDSGSVGLTRGSEVWIFNEQADLRSHTEKLLTRVTRCMCLRDEEKFSMNRAWIAGWHMGSYMKPVSKLGERLLRLLGTCEALEMRF